MSKPFAEATIQGIAFTFERHPCGQWCRHTGSAIGITNFEKVSGTRIGVCAQFTAFSVDEWSSSQSGREHIQRIVYHRQGMVDQQALNDEAGLRLGDSIFQDDKRSQASYALRIKGMTREQAIATYRAIVRGMPL